jgi:hypothetical protein
MIKNILLKFILLLPILSLTIIFSACTDSTGVSIYSIEETKNNDVTDIDILSETNNTAEKETVSAENTFAKDQNEYLLNTNSKKFHYMSCESGQKIKENNRAYHIGTREELIAEGYVPCKACNP